MTITVTRRLSGIVGIGAVVAILGSVQAAAAPQSTEPPSPPTGDSAATADTIGAGDMTATTGSPGDCPTIRATAESSMPDTDAAGAATSAAPASDPTATSADGTVEAAGSVASSVPDDTTGGTTQPSGTDAATPWFVQVAVSEEFGEILVDSQCRGLYAFTQDIDGEPTCVDDCAEAWPPLIVEDRTQTFFPDDPDPDLFTGVEHPQGEQVKFGDWPLYRFAQDTAPGDINGQGVGGVWWLVGPDGTLIDDSTTEDSSVGTSSQPVRSIRTNVEGSASGDPG